MPPQTRLGHVLVDVEGIGRPRFGLGIQSMLHGRRHITLNRLAGDALDQEPTMTLARDAPHPVLVRASASAISEAPRLPQRAEYQLALRWMLVLMPAPSAWLPARPPRARIWPRG